ncbi:RdgB/HAM1 family non-canonical purine NTP pyrophosphatase [Pseudoramibacter porci]|uniref:dITP/XTP pyrophosphatase n=1 Tax=Pseudoramibacter porci TaxID=2606631 RepID=A0A7X2TA10_9FIRM|nr:RdgB/HAM1 family non-canonical purine NTP pyrophosphatase [Pseudoramibacter porci]MSS19942.1 RdgB/HAM1 family non-canonical purine NTP pyrophosphatase [Pseudoramibacter porci]
MNNYKIIVATSNNNKVKEIKDVLGSSFEIMTMGEAGIDVDIIEDGTTFEENALIKVRAIKPYVKDINHTILLADDSGLCVDALDGEPGIFSARYAGLNVTYLDNNKKLLNAMKNVPLSERDAEFICSIALIFPDNEEWTCRSVVHGKIATELTGHDGFGYDPLFIENKSGLTYAQMSLEEKNEISHRAIAIKKACQKIRSKINS